MGNKFARVSFNVGIDENATEADVERLLLSGNMPSEDIFSVEVEEVWEED